MTVVMSNMNSDGAEASRDMRESQRALELRKFFAPNNIDNTAIENSFNESLKNDGALDAYAETIVWRLRGVHAMVSLIDRETQYFLAGAIRTSNLTEGEDVITTKDWFGCSTVPTPDGLCENTLALDIAYDKYPCFIVNDLSQDGRFANLPVVDGSIAAYRFYAGTPITTNHGINIGSFFLFDDKPRDTLSLEHRRFMHQQAGNVMKHLETKREAAERRRVALMSKGIATFLERTSQENELNSDDTMSTPEDESRNPNYDQSSDLEDLEITNENTNPGERKPSTSPKESILDKIRMTLDYAADILRESLELTVGGVVFLDTTVGYMETGNVDAYLDPDTDLGAQVQQSGRELTTQEGHKADYLRPALQQCRHLSQGSIRSSEDKYKASKVLSMSAAKIATWDPQSRVLDGKTLQSLINSYPKGNVWYLDDEGYFSSLEQINEYEETAPVSPSGRRRSISPFNATKQNSEAALLSRIFHKARQIIFLPLWDAGGDRWYSGCFVWSQSAVPVFTVDSEIAYLSAFTNSVMVEISRLDAITSNKIKSDFISSISHEFRSPLHGILASAEFLRDSHLDASQTEFISTIQNCSGTLLDTINHVLDYSKINSFEKTANHQGTISNGLYQATNLALLCEDIINGMIAANEFRNNAGSDPYLPLPRVSSGEAILQPHEGHPSIEIIVDIERRDWVFNIQPGALRRVVMNLFGNAQKYTTSGYIMVQLGMKDSVPTDRHGGEKSSGILSLHIRDTGKGMSSEYMERKLYHPFAQEDTFAPGIGLGLSIVWSIVNQLGGKISIRSELGKGTDVEVTIPVEKLEADTKHTFHNPGDLMKVSADAQECIETLRRRAVGMSVCVLPSELTKLRWQHKDVSWSCIERYCSEWFGFEVGKSSTGLIITDQHDLAAHANGHRILLVHDKMSCPVQQPTRQNVEHICTPIGPFKLARCIVALLDRDISQETSVPCSRSDMATQTPLGSPEERTMLNGMIMTDYGFTPEKASSTPASQLSSNGSENKSESINTTLLLGTQQREESDQFLAGLALSGLSLKLPPTSRGTQSPALSIRQPTLPQVQLPTEVISSTDPRPSSSAGLRILAVDDNDINLQLLRRYLSKRPSDTVVTACNGIEAVAAVRNAGDGKKFDIVFMDISMPEMDGFEATRLVRSFERSLAHRSMPEEIREETRDNGSRIENVGRKRNRAYIVALTGLASRRDRDEAKESGFDDFLTKPISFTRIGELLKRLSDEKVEVN